MQNVEKLDKKLTANQLYKNYRDEGGTLGFSDWLTREKTKGVFPINGTLDKEVKETIGIMKRKNSAPKTLLGLPVSTLVITGAVIVAAIVVTRLMRKSAAQ